MTKKNPTRKTIGRLSRALKDASAAAVASMDSTVGDGLPPERAASLVTILISTPRGQVTSRPLPSEAADEVRELIESGITQIDRLSVDSPSGLVIIPGDLLRQSLIQFLTDDTGKASVKRRSRRTNPRVDADPL